MVQSCCAIGCTNKKTPGNKLRFFRYPFRNLKRLALWTRATKRANWAPSKYSALCADHFQTGEPHWSEDHPDYIPNIFVFTKGKKRSAVTVKQRNERVRAREERKKTTMRDLKISNTKPSEDSQSSVVADNIIRHPEPSMEPNLLDASAVTSNSSSEDAGDISFNDELLREFQKVVKDNTLLRSMNEKLEKEKEKLNITIDDLAKRVRELERRDVISQSLLHDNESLTNVIKDMQKKIGSLHDKINRDVNCPNFLNDKKICKFYTGLPNKEMFQIILEEILKHLPRQRLCTISPEKKLLMVLMKLKLNLYQEDIAHRFCTSFSTVSRIFRIWLPVVGQVLGSLVKWSSHENIKASAPECFKGTRYEETVLIVKAIAAHYTED